MPQRCSTRTLRAGVKDNFASRIFYEPLAQWDADANLEPVLAAEIPSRENGGLAADGRSVVWRLKKGVTWHDGQPFTADDVVFNWQYAIDAAAATITAGAYDNLKLEKIDAHTVRVVFSKPTPFWPGLYAQVMLVPRHLFAAYSGAKSRDAPNNNRPVGTGAYTFVDFKPGDLLRAAINPRYHQANRPHFDTLELKGGGDTTSAARTVLQTGEYDYAGSLLVDDEVLKRMEAGGKGRVQFLSGSATTAVYLNYADPGTEVDGERSNPKTHHPLFSDPDVRRAMGLLIDRQSIQTYVFGRQGEATTNFINNPPRYRSPNNKAEFSIDKAKAVLDAAGWKPALMACARRAARSWRCCSRPPATPQCRSTRPSSSRRHRRPESRSNSRRSCPACSSRLTWAIPTRTESSTPTCRPSTGPTTIRTPKT